MESFKSEDNGHISLKDLKQNALKLCNGNVATYNISNGFCMHAIGHAAMHLADYDIPSALDACASFDKPLEQYQCATGAYMERDLYYGAEDAKMEGFYPCRNSLYSVACFAYRVKYLKQNNTVDQIVKSCLEIPDDRDETSCFFDVGYAYLVKVIEDPQFIRTICSHGSENDRLACIDGSVGTIGIVQPDRAVEACDYVSEEEKKHCLAAASAGQTLEIPDLSIYGID